MIQRRMVNRKKKRKIRRDVEWRRVFERHWYQHKSWRLNYCRDQICRNQCQCQCHEKCRMLDMYVCIPDEKGVRWTQREVEPGNDEFTPRSWNSPIGTIGCPSSETGQKRTSHHLTPAHLPLSASARQGASPRCSVTGFLSWGPEGRSWVRPGCFLPSGREPTHGHASSPTKEEMV